MTLVELLVVLGIIGLVLGISLPGFGGYAKQLRLKTATRQVMGLVSLARSLAIGGRAEYAVVFDAERGEVTVMNMASGETLPQIVRLHQSLKLEFETGGEPSAETRVVFRSNGALAGRTTSLILSDRDRHRTITVTGATGAILLADEQGQDPPQVTAPGR